MSEQTIAIAYSRLKNAKTHIASRFRRLILGVGGLGGWACTQKSFIPGGPAPRSNHLLFL